MRVIPTSTVAVHLKCPRYDDDDDECLLKKKQKMRVCVCVFFFTVNKIEMLFQLYYDW